MSEVTTANVVLQELIGKVVSVESLRGERPMMDRGVLEGYDYPWLRLQADSGETLFLMVLNVRLVKAA